MRGGDTSPSKMKVSFSQMASRSQWKTPPRMKGEGSQKKGDSLKCPPGYTSEYKGKWYMPVTQWDRK